MFQYHVTTQSTTQYGKVTSHIYSQFCILHSDHPLDHKTLQCNQLFHHTSIRITSLSLPLSPPMDTSEVCVEVLHMTKGVVCFQAPQHPAEEWTFPLRVGCTGACMLLHTLLDSITFAAVWAHEGFIRLWVILSMATLWCCLIPWWFAKCLLQSGHCTLFPCAQAGWWEHSIH